MAIDTSPSGIKTLIQSGENKQVEFKSDIGNSSALSTLLHAFANSSGGIVLFGVADDGTIIGVNPEKLSFLPSRIRRLANSGIPNLNLDYGTVNLEGKIIPFIQVFPWDDTQSVARAQAEREQEKLSNWIVQLFLVLTLFNSSLYVFGTKIFPQWMFPFGFVSGQTVVLNVAITALLGIIFYGSSQDITPIKLLESLWLFLPFSALFARRSSYREPVHDRVRAKVVTENLPTNDKVLIVSSAAGTVPLPEMVAVETKKIEENVDIHSPEALLDEVAERAAYFANRLERKTTTFLLVGVTIGFIGLAVWAWRFSAPSNASTFLDFSKQIIPRATIFIFIELLAGFFLRQYRIGTEDFKYFFEIEQRCKWKAIAYKISSQDKDPRSMRALAKTFSEHDVSPLMKKGDTTSSLEAMKAESNFAMEALKVLSETATKLSAKNK